MVWVWNEQERELDKHGEISWQWDHALKVRLNFFFSSESVDQWRTNFSWGYHIYMFESSFRMPWEERWVVSSREIRRVWKSSKWEMMRTLCGMVILEMERNRWTGETLEVEMTGPGIWLDVGAGEERGCVNSGLWQYYAGRICDSNILAFLCWR